jgi:CRP/FNR family cyclic AMP-dependent transcriptional regulator
MQGLERIVLDQPFFAGLGPEFGAAISGCARNLRFTAGDYLFREDEPANEFYLLRQGSVALELHSPGQQSLIVATFREGDILDGSWLVPPYRWTFDARASDLVRVLGVDARCLRDKCEADHDLGYELMKRFAGAMGERLRATRLQVADVYGPRRS